MSRRIYIGPVAGVTGGFDMRISRPGFDALTDDVNDPTKISFAMSRALEQRGEVGKIMQTNLWYSLQIPYSEPPFAIWYYTSGTQRIYGEMQLTYWNNGRVNVSTTNSYLSIVVEATRVMAVRTFDGATVSCDITYFILGTTAS